MGGKGAVPDAAAYKAPLLVALSAILWLGTVSLLGRLWDFLYFLLHPRAGAKPGYAPIRDKQQDFFIRRLYGAVQDLWNRPVCGVEDGALHVVKRTLVQGPTGVEGPTYALHEGSKCASLASFDYLGFTSTDAYITPRVKDNIRTFGAVNSSPRVAGGTTLVHERMEALLAEFLGVEAAITYGTGFATNALAIPALAGKGSLILSDAFNHSSIVYGARLSGATIRVFRHNDAKHLEQLLREALARGQPGSGKAWNKVWVLIEGIYSMDGDVCNLRDIVAVCKKYKAYSFMDEAHSLGALGANGRGCCEHAGVDPRDIDLLMGTLSKSFGAIGGYLAGSKAIIDHLRRHSPGHLYACSIPPGVAQQVLGALEVVTGRDGTTRGASKVAAVQDNSNYMRAKLLTMGLNVVGSWDSPVIIIMTYSVPAMAKFSRMCLERGLALVSVGPPAAPLLLARIRLCMSPHLSRKDLDGMLAIIDEVADVCGIKFWNRKAYAEAEAELQQLVASRQGAGAGSKATIAALAEAPCAIIRTISSSA